MGGTFFHGTTVTKHAEPTPRVARLTGADENLTLPREVVDVENLLVVTTGGHTSAEGPPGAIQTDERVIEASFGR